MGSGHNKPVAKSKWGWLVASLMVASLVTLYFAGQGNTQVNAAGSEVASKVLVSAAVEAKNEVGEDREASPEQISRLRDALSDAVEQEAKESAVKRGESGRRLEPDEGATSLRDLIDQSQSLLAQAERSAGEVIDLATRLEALTLERFMASSSTELGDYFKEANAQGFVAVYAAYLDDGQIIYEYNGSQWVRPASTYKLFVAYSMLKAVEDGEATWDDPLISGRSLSKCFDDMIVYSDNACPEAWLEKVGMPEMQKRADELGAEETVFEWSNLRVSARDLSVAMGALLTTDVIEEESREILKTALKNQKFQEGVAAAFPKYTVVGGKVGFLRGLLHDTAFVESDKGDFVITVLTENKQWATITEATEEVYDRMPSARPSK